MRSAAPADPAKVGFELVRRFRASPERVFRAWTQPVALRQWWCPAGWVAGEIAIDLRPGGNWRIAMTRAGGGAEVSVSGKFVDVRPAQRLAYTWRWEGGFAQMPETLVTVELQESDGDTVLTLRHENFTDLGIRQQHRSGWIAACDRLDRAITPPAALHERTAAG